MEDSKLFAQPGKDWEKEKREREAIAEIETRGERREEERRERGMEE